MTDKELTKTLSPTRKRRRRKIEHEKAPNLMLRGLTTTLLNGVARRNRVSRLANWETSERKGSPVTPRHNAGMGRFTDTKKPLIGYGRLSANLFRLLNPVAMWATGEAYSPVIIFCKRFLRMM